MAKFLAAKHLNSLRPVDEAGEDALRKIGQGDIVKVEVRKPRNVQHHRLFWALMSLVWQQLDHEEYPSVEDLVARVKIATGHRQRIEMGNGMVAFIPKSIAFAKMDQTAFSDFYERVCDLIASKILPGISKGDLKREVEIMIGARDAA